MKAVVLLSGGIDSSTTMAVARSEGFDLYALTFDYAQRHRCELEAAGRVAAALGAARHLVMTFDLRGIGGSALTSDMEVPRDKTRKSGVRSQKPEGTGERIPDSHSWILNSGIPITYVPARNTIFLSFALAWAEVLETPHIFIGANALDYSGYPDCRPEYLKAFEEMANLATRVSVEGKIRFGIRAPLLLMTKGEIIRKGAESGLDYALTWSCYDPQPVKEHGGYPSRAPSHGHVPCESCDSCLFRAKGFREAGLIDPLLSERE
jgi:7-cyano-7-deazaguanine synthase